MKKKRPLSLKRILLVLAGFFALPLFLLLGDSILESRNNYCDMEPLWIHDGREFVFVRWHWQKGSSRNILDLYTADSDGDGERLLYSFQPGFHIYGLRFLKVSRDGRLLFIRITRKDSTYRYSLRDYLFAIPLDRLGEVRIWELDKKSQDDIILAYDEGTALVRRIGSEEQSRLLFTDFGQNSVFSEFAYPLESYCQSAVVFDRGNQALVLISDDRPGKNVHRFFLLSRDGKSNRFLFSLDQALISPHYIPAERKFVSTGVAHHDYFYIVDEMTGKTRKIINPSPGEKPVFQFSLAPSGEEILLTCHSALYCISTAGRGYRKLEFPVTLVPPAVQRQGDRRLLFSDGISICTSDNEGRGFRKITKVSPKALMQEHGLYRGYRDMRERLFILLCDRVLGKKFCESTGLHDEGEHDR